MSSALSSRRGLPWLALAAFAACLVGLVSCARNEKPGADASAAIPKNLGGQYQSAESEALWIDDYRGFYGVFFTMEAAPEQIRADVLKSGLTAYETNTRERHDAYLYRSEYKRLTKLKWEPPKDFAGCDRYVGTWEGKYLVHVAVCGNKLFGYYQNNYNEAPGPGPYR